MKMPAKIVFALASLFLILLPLQFLFAGVGVFGGGFDTHEVFGAGVLHGITVLMTIAALVGKRWREAGLSFALVVVIFLQISLVSIGRDADSPWISALHPFLAFCYWPYVYFLIWSPLKKERDAGAAPAAPAA